MGCEHGHALHISSRLSYDEAVRDRNAFAAEFPRYYVSSVERGRDGFWGWVFCPECASGEANINRIPP
jgi:hypothetical protein